MGGLCVTDRETEVGLSVPSCIHGVLGIYIQITALNLDCCWENTSVVSMVLQTHPLSDCLVAYPDR